MPSQLLSTLRMGRISYLNVLPIYHPLEAGIIEHDFELVSAPPAVLNEMMAQGQLQVSSCSCFEYARNPGRYYLVEDLGIGSRGPVMSVLLMSSLPMAELSGKEILISGESHTSVALLRLLMQEYFKVKVSFTVGAVSSALRSDHAPEAFLAIGDEALRLRGHPDYPLRIDLAEAWRKWTGLPFIFGLWVIDRKTADSGRFSQDPGALLRQGRDWGLAHLDVVLNLTAHGCPLSRDDLEKYYHDGLVYSLGREEIQGLELFYRMLERQKMIAIAPRLEFWPK